MRVMVDGVVREVLGWAEGVETWRRSWVVIPAGVTVEEFRRLVESAGGEVYTLASPAIKY